MLQMQKLVFYVKGAYLGNGKRQSGTEITLGYKHCKREQQNNNFIFKMLQFHDFFGKSDFFYYRNDKRNIPGDLIIFMFINITL